MVDIFGRQVPGTTKAKTLSRAVRGTWIEVLGIQIYYRVAGSGGPPLLLIHGGGSDHSGFSWKYVLDKLGQRRRVIAIDLPGYGKSQAASAHAITAGYLKFRQHLPLPDTRGHFFGVNIPHNANIAAPPDEIELLSAIRHLQPNPFRFNIDFINAFLDALDIRQADIAGLSMGGGIALGLASYYPNRVRRLALVDSYGLSNRIPGGRWTVLAARLPYFNAALRKLLQRYPVLVAGGLKNLIYRKEAITEALVHEAHQAICRAGSHPAWKAFLERELTIGGAATHFADRLADLQMPVLVMHGEFDRLFPLESAQEASKRIANANLEIFKNCGHNPPLEIPEVFTDSLLDFLNAPPAAQLS